MADTTNIDSLVIRINRMMEDHHRQIALNQVPDFHELEVKMKVFDEELNHLSGEQARKYTEILRIWVDSIRQMTSTLERYKEDVESKLSDYQSHSSAVSAYKKHE
jgi:isoleucyl-tRNA synthetase